MSKSNVIILAVVVYVLGVVSGLFVAAYKGAPPGLERQAAGPVQSATPTSAMPPPPAADMAQVQAQLAALDKQIEAAPDNYLLYVQAGNLLFDNNLDEQAVKYYNQALEKGGENPDVLTDCGISYRRLDQPEKAVEYFRRARKADPRHVNSALNLGIVLFHDLQRNEEAVAAWKEYLALNPTGERADMIRRVVSQIESGN